MSNETLRPDGRPVQLAELGFVLVSRTLSAEVTALPGTTPGTRSGGPGLTPAVLRSAEVREMGTVVLQDHHPDRAQDKEVSLYVPGGGKEDGRLLLYFDENGGVTFHLPQSERQPPAGVRADRGEVIRFDVPLRRPVQEPGQARPVRGVGGMIAKKVLKVIGWKVAGMAAAHFGPSLVRRWENKHRPLRTLSRANLFTPQAPALQDPIPPGERSLLFIHGTFSRVASAFNGIPDDEDFLAALDRRYREHIYGFDHPTLATGVATNVMQFYEKLAPGSHNFDIICHSRGGLVARALRDLDEAQLKERFTLDARRGNYEPDLVAWGHNWRIPAGVAVNVGRILFAATPNNGTVLAQPSHLKKYLEILMTATNILPEVADVTVDVVLMLAKLLLTDVMPALPGLDDQQPESSLMLLLKAGPGAHDAGIQADYAPPPGLQAIMRSADQAMNFVFGQKQNDLVVPTLGVSHWPGGVFAPGRLLTFAPERSVYHCNIFLQPETRRHLLACLDT